MNMNEEVCYMCLFIFVCPRDTETWKSRRGKGVLRTRNRSDLGQTGSKIQSVSAAPGIATAPRSVVQVPMPDDEATDSGGVAAGVPMLCGDGQLDEGEEDDESGNDDDEEEVHEINREELPKRSSMTLQ